MTEPDSVKNDSERGKGSLAVRVGKLLTFSGFLCAVFGVAYSSDSGFGKELTVSDLVGGPSEVAMWKFGLGVSVVGMLVLAEAIRSYGFWGVFERPRWR